MQMVLSSLWSPSTVHRLATELDATLGCDLIILDISCVVDSDFMIIWKWDFGLMHVQSMPDEYNGMVQSGHFPHRGGENRSGWRALGSVDHPQIMRAILWNKSYCWLLCNLPCCSLLLSTSTTLPRAKVWCIFAPRNQFSGNKAPHVDCLSPEYEALIGPERGHQGGQEIFSKIKYELGLWRNTVEMKWV